MRFAAALLCLAWMAPAASQERVRHALGDFEYVPTSNGVLIAAPHGTFDANTAPLAIDAARQAGAGYVAAWRFNPDKIRLNVNRPTEGAFLACAQEAQTERAKGVYEVYSGLVAKAASGSALRLYVEIHGNANPQTAKNVEVATVGVSAAEARAVKDEYATMLAQVRERVPGFPELTLLIEPLDRIYWGAACVKKLGMFTKDFAPRGVHFEFPRSAREKETLAGSAMLVAGIVRRILETP